MKPREIKFRVWDGKRMHSPFELRYGLNQCAVDGHIYDLFSDTDIFLQFTGTKDKDGNDVYEGDIVRAVYRESEGGGWYSDHKTMGAVYFDKNWGVKYDCRSGGQRTADTHWYSPFAHENASKELKQKHWSDTTLPRSYNSVEIVGNIYENPELLP